ncbi:ATP-binding cassette domain-containing protein [Pseudothermotoga thermarum]|uniref:Monosaccharide ABC transporter ATP-binding protein, CUT2 family n=1 Tax=Pseudothermotoga thermarum DSM 5069 TaxID=688269 RepID=F7YYX5_9THEM|nr:ATP-binding cassette domain-containing protein [Pseudothermotoga thermarum]AEH51170.1 monosaccharide ABC transporter ATP-binding protein, CUT2 family [Pseudothermotoga thermarum DSM 5069]
MSELLVEMRGISKRFGKVQALKKVDFSVKKQEVVGLLGDNGAGKSTLIKILVGYYQPDEGEIYFEGKRVQFRSPRESRDLGIETVYQDLALVNLMPLWRNFFLGRELMIKFGPFKFLKIKEMKTQSLKILKDIGITFRDPDEAVAMMSGGERQAIAIARAIHFGAKLLIMDEPTAALSVGETKRVLEHILEAKKKGISVVFITHNIYHVYEVADRLVILEKGEKIGDYKKDEVTPQQVMDIIAASAGVK